MYDGRQRINFLADPRDQLGEVLFGRRRDGDPRKADIYGSVVQRIVMTQREDWPEWVVAFGSGMREHIDKGEAHFVDAIWEGIVKTLNPKAEVWADALRD